MFGEPGPHTLVLMGAVVVADEMDLSAREPTRHRVEELDELDVRMAREAAPVHLAARDFKRREQTGRSVSAIVVSHPRRKAGPHGKQRLGAVERLDLRLLIDAQYQRLLRGL